jgi:MT0933-like antitoxin protein
MPGLDDIKQFADDHDEQLDQGLEKAGDAAGTKVGHEDQIDKGVDWAQQHTGGGDTQPGGQDESQK